MKVFVTVALCVLQAQSAHDAPKVECCYCKRMVDKSLCVLTSYGENGACWYRLGPGRMVTRYCCTPGDRFSRSSQGRTGSTALEKRKSENYKQCTASQQQL